jgi:hypothetical protein
MRTGWAPAPGSPTGASPLYSIFSISQSCAATFTASERAVGLVACREVSIAKPVMTARTEIRAGIDDKHARAICDEIGDRLRENLNRAIPRNLPARLQELIDLLAAADHARAPSIVPSLDDITSRAVSATTT